jgi:hypothetical protein
VLLLTLAAIRTEIGQGETTWWADWGALVLAANGFMPTLTSTVPNACRLGMAADTAQEQSRLAGAVCRDHVQPRADKRGADPATDRATGLRTKREAGRWVNGSEF